jgi:rubrerythrin
MDFVKAREVLEVIQKLDADSKESIINALNIALHVEEASKGFYEAEVEKTRGSELCAFFEFLVKEEEMHLEKVLELKREIEESENESLTKEINFNSTSPPNIRAIPSGQSELTAVLYALWREKKAVEFYEEAAKKTKNGVKKFFEDLTEFERGHVKLLEGIIEDTQNTSELIMG